ncbi:SGNH/GDSL hydrolase family protein [Curtobacterium sp. VKM Ac-2922]|uniref:SGNH/GDSL hydrolase family protein n=1 Tax=Curtobacterium sp. VKM Ac-2922 TaxID=2929475 RepID=UPI001FB54BAE|nr:SGNH/GDSL hydrolase family protein [Curtobacterium sp. VKM Ac-2922]MCJ1713633.1 SGNH/GDSL hydrolase family protein [Curtobacterium sp. VKM Ac-2922]
MQRTGTMIAVVVAGLAVVAGIGYVAVEHPTRASAGATATATTTPPRGTRVVTIGDSIMAGYGLDSAADAWPAMLGRVDHLRVTNLGCSGGGFVAVGDCDTDFAGLVAQAEAAHPAIVIVQSSDNDLGQDAATIESATAATVAQLHAALPSARIVGLSTLWGQPGDVPDEVAQSSASLQRAVQAAHGTFVDVGQPLAGHADLLQSDSEHPTVAGQRVLTRVIQHDLRRAGVAI